MPDLQGIEFTPDAIIHISQLIHMIGQPEEVFAVPNTNAGKGELRMALHPQGEGNGKARGVYARIVPLENDAFIVCPTTVDGPQLPQAITATSIPALAATIREDWREQVLNQED